MHKMFDIKSYMHTEQTERSLSQVSLYSQYASKNYPNEQLAKNEVEISGGQKTDGEESNMWKGLGGDDGEGEEEEEGGGEGGAVMKIK